jgi:hypothetical protein
LTRINALANPVEYAPKGGGIAMSRLFPIGLLTLSVAALAQIAAAQEQAKWFLLRDHKLGTCWPALLVKVDGSYAHGLAQRAGGPYDTEEQAADRRKALQETGTCEQ